MRGGSGSAGLCLVAADCLLLRPVRGDLVLVAALLGFGDEALEIEAVPAGQCAVLAALQGPIDLGLGTTRAQGGLLALQARGLCPGQALLG